MARSPGEVGDIEKVESLMREAEDMDALFAKQSVSDTAGHQYSFSPVSTPSSSPGQMPSKQSVHTYSSIGSAIYWNRIRSLRLMVLGTVVRTADLIKSVDKSRDSLKGPHCNYAYAHVRQIVDELCSSLPFCVGSESSSHITSPTSSGLPPKDSIDLTAIGPDRITLTWDLIWTFQLASTFQCVPHKQREWMQHHIHSYKTRHQCK